MAGFTPAGCCTRCARTVEVLTDEDGNEVYFDRDEQWVCDDGKPHTAPAAIIEADYGEGGAAMYDEGIPIYFELEPEPGLTRVIDRVRWLEEVALIDDGRTDDEQDEYVALTAWLKEHRTGG